MKTNRQIYKISAALGIFLILQTVLAKGPSPEKEHNFGRAEVVDRVILSVIEHYYDPARIDPLDMFRSMIDALQKGIAEIKVSFDKENQKASIDVLDNQIVIDTSELNSPWDLSRAIHKVFRFIQEQLPREEYDYRTLEYATANAMLMSLDPHSNALPPEIFKELRMEIAGEFGGLGIRITTDRRPPCHGNLTVVDVFDNTPASRSGLKPGDQIIRIEGESTVNITTSEAAQRLRGPPGSSVRIQIRRTDGTNRTLNVQREMVSIDSVEWKMLDDKVGYVLLRAFQNNSLDQFRAALKSLQDLKSKGLILDLRDNPGGSLPVAIDIVDSFISSGTIVKTAGRNGEKLEVNNANADGTEALYPIAVLINSNSASAAEILAGALRNHSRALLVGETTFGKGSVQFLQPIPDGGALKLTSAQYLTPGDISIQAVGVAPDVIFVPYTVDLRNMDLGRANLRFSEADLEHHLDRPSIRTRSDRPGAAEAMLFIPAAKRKADQDRYKRCFVDNDDRRTYQERYEVEFSRRLIAKAKPATSEELLVLAREQIAEDNKGHAQSMQRALKKLGVDWSPAPESATPLENNKKSAKNPPVTATARIIDKVELGKNIRIKATVKNSSAETIYQLRAVTKSDNHMLDGHDLVFGKVKPGQRKNWTAVVELPPTAPARVDEVTVKFDAASGPVPEPVIVEVKIPERPRPRLAYSWQFEDLGNGNGVVETGEEVIAHVTVKNVGRGATVDAQADLSAKPGVDVVQGRFELGRLRPGESARGRFRLRVGEQFHEKTVELSFSVRDWIPARFLIGQVLLQREIDLSVSPPTPGPESASGGVTIQKEDGAVLREGPSSENRDVARAIQGASFIVDASIGNFFRVVLDKNRHAWIKRSDTTPGKGSHPKFSPTFVEPPLISIKGKQVRRVQNDKIVIEGEAKHPVHVRDLMVFVGDSKLLYMPNKDKSSSGRVEFKLDVPLEIGANLVMVVARHDDKDVSSMPIFVRRDAPKE
ncbi:MAG: PDZ domain-containing protein [Proteobacteria bacterium]|nr:PDZ domain-containing protein [Pseudomonadota bacterium]